MPNIERIEEKDKVREEEVRRGLTARIFRRLAGYDDGDKRAAQKDARRDSSGTDFNILGGMGFQP